MVVFSLPVIALTAHATAGDRERLLAEGFDDVVTRPALDEGVLPDAIERCPQSGRVVAWRRRAAWRAPDDRSTVRDGSPFVLRVFMDQWKQIGDRLGPFAQRSKEAGPWHTAATGLLAVQKSAITRFASGSVAKSIIAKIKKFAGGLVHLSHRLRSARRPEGSQLVHGGRSGREAQKVLCADAHGFSLHAAVRCVACHLRRAPGGLTSGQVVPPVEVRRSSHLLRSVRCA